MKTHTSSFKEQIKLIGKEIDSRITFGSTVLGKNDLNAVTPSYQGAILKSVMKQLDIDSNVAIPIGTILKYEFGLKVNGEYEYINYGNYVVYSVEKQEDTKSYKITCYDKLLYSMLDYVKLPITYPISIRDYINLLSTALGLKFANKSGTFANYDKQIQADLYDGLGYTFRDILDELAQVTASTICLNNNDELEIRYITETNDVIDEEFLKDVNVNFGEKFGAVNTIVLSRSADSDSVYYPSTLPANPYEIKISDNQIMNGNDRADFLPDIYNKLNGLEFYTNDFVSTGICYYDLCDRYSVKVGDNTYSCVMFNDEVLVTQGLEENIYTELPEQTETDYKHASKDDRMINQVYIIAKKNEAEILAVVNTTKQIQKEINPTKDENGSKIIIEDASNNPLTYLEIEGKSVQDETPSPEYPSEIKSVGTYNEETGKYEIEVKTVGKNLFNAKLIPSSTGIIVNEDGSIITMPIVSSGNGVVYTTLKLSQLAPSLKVGDNVYLKFNRIPSGLNELIYLRVANMSWYNNTYKTITQDMLDSEVALYANRYGSGETEQVTLLNFIMSYEKKTFDPYQKNTSVIELNEPLRSLPNGIKDIAYIRNNKLYVDRYVGSVVLDGSENWVVRDKNDNGYSRFYVAIDDSATSSNASKCICNMFTPIAYGYQQYSENLGVYNKYYYPSLLSSRLIDTSDNAKALESFKNWLSTHNTKVIYELATPVTEELGEIEMLKTLKGYNNISTTDELLPIINLTYVRDTIIADYVENHVTELKLAENEIKASVESVSSSVDGLNTTINRVEEITNDNSQVINIISTNIDRTTGEVREVTTTNGFKFDSKGLNIYTDENSYNTQIDNVGTYYKDGNEVISQTTKDGSILKDLKTQGQSQYSYDGDSYDFIEERVEVDGEYCYATFYNGEE